MSTRNVLGPAACLAAGLALFSPAARAAGAAAAPPETVTVVVDDSAPAPGRAALLEPAAPPAGLEPWRRWAHLDGGAPFAAFRVSAPGAIVGQAARFPHGDGALLTNVTDRPFTLRVGARLGAGLWRVEAALAAPKPSISGDDEAAAKGKDAPPPPASVRAWRMESVFQAQAGAAYKAVRLGPGETLIVRWTDTVAEADAACRAARQSPAASGGPTTYTGVTVARALDRAADLIGQIEVLTARGRRGDVVKRAQSALLLAAQAQAMARNRDDVPAAGDNVDGGGGSGGDAGGAGGAGGAVFTRLTGALSEVSCAACDLIPAEAAVTDSTGSVVAVRVSVTNGGSRTIPSVSLALPQPGDGAGLGVPGGERTVFRSLAPGATVTARFPVVAQSGPPDADPAGPTSRAILQFILDMGAAVVPTGPAP